MSSSEMDSFSERFQTVVPLLQVNDIQQTITYYGEVFGFSLSFLWPNEDEPKWAAMTRDDVTFMFTIDLGTSSSSWIPEKGNGVVLYVVIEDAAALYAELLEREAIIVQELRSFGERRQFSVADPSGYVIAFSEPLTG